MRNLIELLRLDNYQMLWTLIIIPILAYDSIYQLRRGWKIVKHRQNIFHWVVKFRIWFIRNFIGPQQAHEYYTRILNDKSRIQLSGIYAIIYGVITIPALMVLIVAFLCTLFS
jgi:hypothetical protein